MSNPLTTAPLHRTVPSTRRAGMILAGALLAGSIATVVAPAESASALAIDCSYDSGLSVFIGTGRDGLTCMGGGTRTPGTVYGSGSLPGQSAPGGASVGSACSSSTPGLPDNFYAWGAVTAFNDVRDYVDDDGVTWHTTLTFYSRGGRTVATRGIATAPGKPLHMQFNDQTLMGPNGGGVRLSMSYDCDKDSTWVTAPPQIIEPRSPEFAATPMPGPVSSRTLDTRASMMPVPFQPGQYFLRVDLKNNHSAPSTTPVHLDLDLTSYTVSTLASSPTGSSCPSATSASELCVSPTIASGESQSFLFVVKIRPGAVLGAPLAITTYHEGHVKVEGMNRKGNQVSTIVVAPAA